MSLPATDSNMGLGGVEIQQHVLECLSRRAGGAPWLLAGDYNATPDESHMVEWLVDDGCSLLALRDESGSLKTTIGMVATVPLTMGLPINQLPVA